MEPSPRQQEELTTRSPLQPPGQRTRCFVCAVVVSVCQRGAEEAPARNEAWPAWPWAGEVRTTVHHRPKQLPTNLELRPPTQRQPAISRAMPLRVLKRMARGESPLPAVPRAVTDCDRIKVDRQTASQQAEDSDEGGPERIASSPLRMALIQLPLGSPFPAAGWGPVRNTAKLIAPPLDLGARAAPSGLCLHTITPCRQLRRPWPMQVPQHCSSHGENKKKKSCPPPRQPARASRRRTSPSPTWAGGLEPPRPTRRTPLFLPSHSALLGAGGGRALGGLAAGLSRFGTSEAVASAPDSRG